MAIKPPPYCKNAEPTPIGWRDPRTREILAVRKISQADIDEYYLSHMDKDALEAKARESGVELDKRQSREALVSKVEVLMENDITSMNKKQLEEFAREHGVELDRRKTKAVLLAEVQELLS